MSVETSTASLDDVRTRAIDYANQHGEAVGHFGGVLTAETPGGLAIRQFLASTELSAEFVDYNHHDGDVTVTYVVDFSPAIVDGPQVRVRKTYEDERAPYEATLKKRDHARIASELIALFADAAE